MDQFQRLSQSMDSSPEGIDDVDDVMLRLWLENERPTQASKKERERTIIFLTIFFFAYERICSDLAKQQLLAFSGDQTSCGSNYNTS